MDRWICSPSRLGQYKKACMKVDFFVDKQLKILIPDLEGEIGTILFRASR